MYQSINVTIGYSNVLIFTDEKKGRRGRDHVEIGVY